VSAAERNQPKNSLNARNNTEGTNIHQHISANLRKCSAPIYNRPVIYPSNESSNCCHQFSHHTPQQSEYQEPKQRFVRDVIFRSHLSSAKHAAGTGPLPKLSPYYSIRTKLNTPQELLLNSFLNESVRYQNNKSELQAKSKNVACKDRFKMLRRRKGSLCIDPKSESMSNKEQTSIKERENDVSTLCELTFSKLGNVFKKESAMAENRALKLKCKKIYLRPKEKPHDVSAIEK